MHPPLRRSILDRDLSILIAIAAARFIFHLLTNGAYGWHRDELAVLDDARHLAWGYVAYPPVTPFIARIGLELFGPSMTGVRMFGALAQSIIMVLTGLMARDLGARRAFQLIAALAAAIAPMSFIMTSLFQYITFDALWWVVVAWSIVRTIRTDDPRWWILTGAAIGFGMMTKYTMAYWVLGVVAGVLLTPLRSHLRSGWLWAGVAVSLLIFLPNFLWQWRHDFISLEFLQTIHARDVAIGRTGGFITQQFYVATSLVTVPLWLAGLWFVFFDREGRRYRALGWMYLVVLTLMLASRGRFYYLTPAYPMLLAAGAVVLERWVDSMRQRSARIVLAACSVLIALGFALSTIIMSPIAPIGSPIWDLTAEVHDNFREQIGWPEMTAEVARIFHSLPDEEQARTGVFTGNYGEAGAINLYGPAYGLPQAISGINSYWYRGYGDPPPQTLIIVGGSLETANGLFEECRIAGTNRNRFGVVNEESRDHPEILLCREPLFDWSEIWPELQSFG